MGKQLVVFLFFVVAGITAMGQTQPDSGGVFKGEARRMSHADLDSLHSPKTATILSAILPGAGQVYNKKYFKAPIILGGFGAALYSSQWQRERYNHYRDEYAKMIDTNQTSIYDDIRSPAYVKNARDYHKQWMEISYIAMGLIYALQILDANVDAHLMSFDVGDDLSMQVMPNTWRTRHVPAQAFGLTLRLHIKPSNGYSYHRLR
jgi:hypothetical protein